LKPKPQSRTRTIAAEVHQPFKWAAAQALAQAEAQRRLAAEELAQGRKPNSRGKSPAANSIRSNFVSTIQQAIAQAQVAESQINLDERETRRLIDAQLRAGWKVDSELLTYQKTAPDHREEESSDR